MIPQNFITEWRAYAPWTSDWQVEQDLVICRALLDIYSNPVLQSALAFRGGTALHKLYVTSPQRYSEDIDLVQVSSGPIGPILDALRASLDAWLGKPVIRRNQSMVTLVYRFDAEDTSIVGLKLKVEINTREHGAVYGFCHKTLVVNSSWSKGSVSVLTYSLEELLGTKLRALYQRRKSRDLFDLDLALRTLRPDTQKVIQTFLRCIDDQGLIVTRAMFEENLTQKRAHRDFMADMQQLLVSDAKWQPGSAFERVWNALIVQLPGAAWKLTQLAE